MVLSEERKLKELRKEIADLCQRINKRIKELGDADIMTYRSDPIIKGLQNDICKLYRNAIKSCKTYGEASEICKLFMNEPSCLTQMMLSDEVVCFEKTEDE